MTFKVGDWVIIDFFIRGVPNKSYMNKRTKIIGVEVDLDGDVYWRIAFYSKGGLKNPQSNTTYYPDGNERHDVVDLLDL